ncbi:MAG: 5-(carboxyamino)imidazole ribonucleotide synthase [Candidatus Eremiobacteraeota bacterium]|nr:5-(carboxyamino)imidazole ribonucleotide synthase [Candidatus Eremiobacteraeota bacterium]
MKVGILGAGQLGRMLAGAALQLGLEPHLYDPETQACGHSAGRSWPFSYEDQDSLERFARTVELCTFEFENVPVSAVQTVSRYSLVAPGMAALAVSQDRLHEKNFLRTLGIGTPDFQAWVPGAELPPQGILKTRRFGYDGKGQWDLSRSRPQPGVTCICEEKLAFQRELSQIGVRSRSGEIACYPLVETIQREGILCEAIAPARQVSQELVNQARLWVTKILEALDYVGVLALELFEVDGQLLANEMAPRVHNSGHWTDRGCRTSQFENHWRALLGWPLGDTEALGHCRLINLLGSVPEVPPPGVHATYYGKEARPGRKLGHLTCLADTPEAVDEISSGVLSHAT